MPFPPMHLTAATATAVTDGTAAHPAAVLATDDVAAAVSAAPGDKPSTVPREDDGAIDGTGAGPAVVVAVAAPSPARSGAFDVCHAGLVLRALIAAHALLAVGVLFAVRDAAAWFAGVAAGSAVVLPAVLLWLLMSCGLKRPLARAARPLQAAAAAALGVVAGSGGWALGQFDGLAEAGLSDAAWWPLGACASAGALAGLAMSQWLDLRRRARLPADTTARLAELQSRIRPHFLFNTLNTALSLVRLDPARAEGVLEDLSELFRAALDDDRGTDAAADGASPARDGSVTLADEVDLARRYLAIEQVRFGARLRVNWALDDAASAARVPPLLLQPLVENAVRHGVEPAADGGTISVRTHVTLGRAVVTITNSVPSEASTPGHGIALRNVRERLALLHDVAAQLEVRLAPGEFRVRVVVPL